MPHVARERDVTFCQNRLGVPGLGEAFLHTSGNRYCKKKHNHYDEDSDEKEKGNSKHYGAAMGRAIKILHRKRNEKRKRRRRNKKQKLKKKKKTKDTRA